jgi:hypothetical protein
MMDISFHSAFAAIQKSDEFKKFRERNKKAILFSAFFIFNSDFEPETQQVDYLMPNKKKIITFFVNQDGTVNSKKDELQIIKKEALELRTKEIKDLDFVLEEIKKKIKNKPTKIIIILQHQKEKQIWNVSCILQSFKILNLHIDSISGKMLMNKEKNIFDFIQVKKGKKGEK